MKKVIFANKMAENIGKEEIEIDDCVWSNETHFLLSGQFYKQNTRLWGEQKSQLIDEMSLSREKVTV